MSPLATLLLVLALVPLAATLVCLIAPIRALATVTLASGVVAMTATAVLVPAAAHHVVATGFLRVDALSEVFLLPTGFLYAGVAAYSVGYLRVATPPGSTSTQNRYRRLFHVGINAFAWSMLCAPLADGLATLWIAIEITTVVSALLVALDNTEGATEAAWKYVLIASCGLGIGLLSTIVMYYAGAQALGESYDLAFAPLITHASQLPASPVRLAFVLAVIGFGTKVGLFPVHTWLPDAHSEAPTPVSALLSGSLLAVSFYAILRYYQVAHLTLGDGFPRTVLLCFGIASLALAALSLLEQTNIKRLLAYSSIEHMGILAIGIGFGTRIAVVGVLLHVLAHAAAKGTAFLGAGTLVHEFETKSLRGIRDVTTRLPWTGPLFLASIFALCAMPPFGLFRSEFLIVTGGIATGRHAPAAILLVLVTLAFFGLTRATIQSFFTMPATRHGGAPASQRQVVVASFEAPRSGLTTGVVGFDVEEDLEPPPVRSGQDTPLAWMVAPLVVGLIILVILGVHPPGAISDLLSAAADQLQGWTT